MVPVKLQRLEGLLVLFNPKNGWQDGMTQLSEKEKKLAGIDPWLQTQQLYFEQS